MAALKVSKVTICLCDSCVKGNANALLEDFADILEECVTCKGLAMKDCPGKGPRVQLSPQGKKLDNGTTTWPQPVNKDGIDSYKKMFDLVKKDIGASPGKTVLATSEKKFAARRCGTAADTNACIEKAFQAIGGQSKAYQSDPKESARLLLIKVAKSMGSMGALSDATKATELDPECGLAFQMQAECLEKAGKMAAALDAIDKALDAGGRGFKPPEAKLIKERLEEAAGGAKKAQEEEEAAAKAKAEEEAKKKAEEEAKKKKAEELAKKKKAAEAAKKKKEAEAKKQAEEEAKRKAEEEAAAAKKAEEEAAAAEEEAKRQAEEEAAAAAAAEEEKRKAEEEAAAAKKAEEEAAAAAAKAEEEAAAKAQEEAAAAAAAEKAKGLDETTTLVMTEADNTTVSAQTDGGQCGQCVIC